MSDEKPTFTVTTRDASETIIINNDPAEETPKPKKGASNVATD